MTRFPPLLAALSILGPALRAADEPYKGFTGDVKLLRDTSLLATRDGEVKFSSPKALEASRRIFSKVPFLFKTRQQVLELLGDPATVSDAGPQAETGKNAPLVYRFDSGYGGQVYTLTFEDGVVTGIKVISSE